MFGFSVPNVVNDFLIIFLGLVVEAIPFILLGVVISSLLSLFISEERIIRFLPKNRFLALIYACFTGFLLPVCECGNIPLARKFTIKGVPPYLAITFLLAAPVLNPIVLFSTWAAFRDAPEVIFWRIVFSFITAFVVGLIFSSVRNKQEIITDTVVSLCHHDHGKHDHDHHHHRWEEFLNTLQSEFVEMMTLMIIGGLIAATTQTLLPREWIVSLGTGPVISIVVMLVLAFVVSICSNVDAFFALAYAPLFTTGSIVAFLVFGPMIDIKTLMMMSSTFKPRAIAVMTILTLQLVFILTLILNLYAS